VKVGIAVTCTTCGRNKKPHGRSAPVGSWLCDEQCQGYHQMPWPGCLWPGETDEEFGYPCCDRATELR
jgi:hypothetical protein